MIGWNDEQEALRLAVRRFVEAEIVPIRDELEHGDLAPYDVLRRFYAAFGLDELARDRFERETATVREALSPEDARRQRYDRAVMTLLPMIEISRHCPGLVTALGVSTNLAGTTILRKGNTEQARRWALPLLTLEKVGSWAITEPDSGSDAFGAMRASAVPDGDGYILNGSKTYITNAPFADTIVYICKLDNGAPWRERPVLNFVLDRDTEGLELSRPMRKMGLHSSPTGEVFVRDVRVGPERLLAGRDPAGGGSERGGSDRGGGREAARSVFASERASTAVQALGIIDRCLELSVEYSKNRVQFGKPIAEFQLIQEKLAMMEIARLNVQNMVFRYLALLEAGKSPTFAEASAMKLYSARSAMAVALEAIQLHGGNGYMAEYHVEQLARDAKVLQIYAGTDEQQIIAIAKDLVRR